MPHEESFFNHTEKKGSGEKIGVRVIIEGRVQKVGLRNWIKQKAISLDVCGWVRNRMNDTVEAFFYGSEDAVGEIIEMCYQGPSFAHIKKIKEFPQKEMDNIPREFVILPTV